jgi:hypothetical protein
VSPGFDSQTNKGVSQPQEVSEYFPPMILSIDPNPGAIIQLKQKFTIEFSQVMEKKSVEAAFELTPLVAGRFEWIEGKTVSFIPDQELPVGQNISLRINSFAANLEGERLDQLFQADFQVADPLKVAYKFPESGTIEVDTNIEGIYLTFNQPVLSRLDDGPNHSAAFRIKPDQAGKGQWINNSTYLFLLDHGLAGGTDFQLEINRQLQSIYGTNFEISSDSNWQFRTIDPAIIQFSPSVNEAIPLDQTFKLFFNQSMQTETVAANFYFNDVAGNPVPGRFYWNDLKTEMTFVPEKLLNRATSYLLELKPGSLVGGGTTFSNQLALSYTTIQAFQLLSTTPADQQPINIINGKSTVNLVFSSGLSPDLNYKKYITVYPMVEDLQITPGDLDSKLIISGSMSAGQTYQVLISESLPDKLGSNLDQAYFFEYFISPPDPEVKINDIIENNLLFLSDQNPLVNYSVMNISSLSMVLERLSFSDFSTIQNKESIIDSNIESRQLRINTNILQNQEKALEIDLEEFKINLTPGIYRLTFSSDNNYQFQLFIFLNHYGINSKSSENQLLIWIPNYDDTRISENSKVKVFNETFQLLYETELDERGTAVIDPFLYGRQKLNFWVEFGSPGDKNYSLAFFKDNIDGKETNSDSGSLSQEPDYENFFISDQSVYHPKEPLYFYAVLRSNNENGYFIPEIKDFKFFLKKVDSDTIVEQTNVVLSEFGTITGKILIPENLSDGLYQIGFEPQIISNKTISIDKYETSQKNISIKFNSARYVIGDNISILIESPSPNLLSANDQQIHWTLEIKPKEDISKTSNELVNNIEPKILFEDSQFPGKDGKLTIDFSSDEIEKSLPSNNIPYLLTARLEINNFENLPVVMESESIIYPESYLIDVETEAYYLNDPVSIKAKIFSMSWEKKLIGAIAVNVVLQKAITGKTEDDADQWGDLYKGFLRTDGNGFVEYEAFINGPGIYKLTVLSGKWEITRQFYVAGQGKTQYPLGVDQNLSVVLEKSDFAIDDTAKIFIPNPYNGPATVLLTIERENVLFLDVFDIPDSYLLYEFPIKKDYGPNAFVSVMMVNKESFQDYKFGIRQIFINLETEKLAISADFYPETIDDQDTVLVDISIKDNSGQPVQSEIFLQAIRSDYSMDNIQSPIFEKFYHQRPIVVASNYSGINMINNEIINEFLQEEFIDDRNINPAQTLWIQRAPTDENGHVVVRFPSPYESENLWLKIFAVTEDLKIGNLIESIPPGFTASITPHIPQFVNKGDKFQLGLQVTNLLDFPQSLDVNLELQNLILSGDLSQQITLDVGESKEIIWQVMAEKSGQESINFLLVNPAKESILVTQSLEVDELPAITKTVVNGYLAGAGQLNSYFGISSNNNYVNGVITTYMIPNLSSSLIAGIQSFKNESQTIEQKIWSLLAYSHLLQLIQITGIDEQVLEERLTGQIQDVVQSLLFLQNQDGGWAKIQGNESDPNLTAFCVWGLKLSESLTKNGNNQYLNSALEYMLVNVLNPDSINDQVSFDRQALLYFAINLLDNMKIDPKDLIPYMEFFSNEGKIFLSMALEINNRGDQQAREIIKEVEKSIETSNSDFIIDDDQFSQVNFKSRISRVALTIYALSSIDPASIILNDAVPNLMNSQKTPGQWDSVLETSLSIMAISRYLQGRGLEYGNYEYDTYLNNVHIMNGSDNPINFLPPISNSYEIDNNDGDLLYDLQVNRTNGAGTLYFLTTASFYQWINKIEASNTGFSIQRYYYYPESEINLPDCYSNLCYGDALTVAKSTDEKIHAYLVVTTSKDQQNVFLEENIPAGMVLSDITSGASNINDNFYKPLIRFSENFIKYQNHTRNKINWFAEELPAGTYVVSYLLTPEFIGQFSIPPVRVWARFSSPSPSYNKGQTLTIINR